MAKDMNKALGNLAEIAKNSVEKIDVEAAKKRRYRPPRAFQKRPLSSKTLRLL